MDQNMKICPRYDTPSKYSPGILDQICLFKLIVFSSHNVLNEDRTPRGYCLLKLLRSYLELDMLSSLTLHTDTTILVLAQELLTFGALLDVSGCVSYSLAYA